MAKEREEQQPQLPPAAPSLVVPRRVTPGIDLTAPENAPDGPDGEWSRVHLIQFLARAERRAVYIPKEPYEPKNQETFQTVGYQGHFFTILKGRSELVPEPIAEIIEQSQAEFPTTQSQAIKRQITDIRDLDPDPRARGISGVEVHI